jgi:Zn-finger nucleic acid-binding protein
MDNTTEIGYREAMIRVVCPACETKLNARDDLAGKAKKCPQCGAVIQIPEVDEVPEDADEPTTEIIQANPAETRLPSRHIPERLDRQNRYLICDPTSLKAVWKNDGRGWMLKTIAGFLSAKRNADQLPPHGDFTLVELRMKMTDEGLRLEVVESYQLASRFAMTKLDKGDDDVLHAVTGHGFLNQPQKFIVRQALSDQFMREVWADSTEAMEYLANTDYHSSTSRSVD